MASMSDALLLQMIKSAGASRINGDAGTMLAIFDNGYVAQSLGIEVESLTPSFAARTSDVSRLQLVKDSNVTVCKQAPERIQDEEYRVMRFEPDGTGMTRVVLKR